MGRDLPAGGTGGYVIRLRHENLPAGLSALVRRRSDGDLEVIVSTTLSAGRQRAAVRAGLRAMRPAGRGAGPLRVPALIVIALAGTWLRAIGQVLRLRPAVTIALAVTATAAATIAVAPQLHGPAGAGRNPAGAALAPHRRSAAAPAGPGPATPSASAVAQPLPSATPVAARAPAGTTTTPVMVQPSPAASAPPQPSSAPTPAASGSGHLICVELLGIWICV